MLLRIFQWTHIRIRIVKSSSVNSSDSLFHKSDLLKITLLPISSPEMYYTVVFRNRFFKWDSTVYSLVNVMYIFRLHNLLSHGLVSGMLSKRAIYVHRKI
jgi:hypothetical protein